jgi:hypothetical protein
MGSRIRCCCSRTGRLTVMVNRCDSDFEAWQQRVQGEPSHAAYLGVEGVTDRKNVRYRVLGLWTIISLPLAGCR